MSFQAAEDIASTYASINADEGKSDTLWMAVEANGNKLELAGSGSGGRPELQQFMEDAKDKVLFCLFKVYGVDDRSVVSKRPKLVFVTYVGAEVGVLKKARAGMQGEQVKEQLFGSAPAYSFQINGNDMDAFSARHVSEVILRAGGAHKPVRYEFGGDEAVPLTDILGEDAQCLQAEFVKITGSA